MAFPGYLASVNDTAQFGGTSSHVRLQSVNVCTGTASAVVTLYNGTATTNDVVATIDASAKGSYYFGGLRIPNGLFVKLTGGNALVTVTVTN